MKSNIGANSCLSLISDNFSVSSVVKVGNTFVSFRNYYDLS